MKKNEIHVGSFYYVHFAYYWGFAKVLEQEGRAKWSVMIVAPDEEYDAINGVIRTLHSRQIWRLEEDEDGFLLDEEERILRKAKVKSPSKVDWQKEGF